MKATRPKLIEIDENTLPPIPPDPIKPMPPNICFMKAPRGFLHIVERVYIPGYGDRADSVVLHPYCGQVLGGTFRIRGRDVKKHTICATCRKNALVDYERYARRMARYKELCSNTLTLPSEKQHKYQCPACGLLMQRRTTAQCVCLNPYCKRVGKYQMPREVPLTPIDTE